MPEEFMHSPQVPNFQELTHLWFLPFPRLECGHQFQEGIGRLERQNEFICSVCNKVTRLNCGQIADAIASLKEAVTLVWNSADLA
jgi:hypothetical protein